MTTPKKKEKQLKTSTLLSSTLPFPFLPFLFSALDFFFVFTLKVFPQKKKPFNYSFEKKRDSFCVPSLSFAAAAADLLCDEWTLTTLTTLTTTTMESIEATLWRRSSSADEDLSPNDDDDDDDDGGKKGGIAYRPLVEALKPNGTLRVRVLFDEKDDDEKKTTRREMVDAVARELKMEGIVDVQVITQKKDCDGTGQTTYFVTGTKPGWERGAKFRLNKKKKNNNDNTTTTTKRIQETKNGWTVNGNGDDDDDDDTIIDEDALLTERDKERPTDANAAGCPPTRKPCKDCTCGRKEAEEAKENNSENVVVKMDLENDPNDMTFKSACGNCALGDAFRCAGCPYLGQPAFKEDAKGDKVMLDDLGKVDV